MHKVLTRQARWQLSGAGVGMVALGVLAALGNRPSVIVAAGVGMLALGIFFAARFPERNFAPVQQDKWRAGAGILRRGVGLATRDKTILALIAVTILVNGAADSFGRVYPVRLVEVGLPVGAEATLWFTGISIAGFITGAFVLKAVESRIRSKAGARNSMVLAGIAGALGLCLFGFAPSLEIAIVALLVANGVAGPVMRTVTTIWVNRRTTSEVRATVHSFLAQAEYVGEIATASALAGLAGLAGSSSAYLFTAALFAASAVVVLGAARGGAQRQPTD